MERERIIEALKICDSNYDGVVCEKCPIKDEDYNGSWYDEDGDCYQHLMREAAELLSEQSAIQPEKAQLSLEGTTKDAISRQAAIDALQKCRKHCIDPFDSYHIDIQDAENQLSKLPTIQPERAIPLSWIEKHIEWLKSLDNEFANLAAAHISVMLKKWRSEQNETD